MRRLVLLAVLILTVGLGSGLAISIDPAIDYKVVTGNQAYAGGLSLGMAFEVNSTVYVNALGAFNSSNGFQSEIIASIYKVTLNSGSPALGDLMATATFNTADVNGIEYTQINGAGWKYLPGIVTLTPGTYMIVGQGYNAAEPNWNYNNCGAACTANDYQYHVNSLNTLGGSITYGVGPQYGNAYGLGGASLPSVWDAVNPGVIPIRYGAATFSAFVPEPGTYVLMGTVGLALVLLRRRASAAKS